MRVLLADDQADLRSALRLLLEQEPGVESVGEVADVDALLGQVVKFQPDLLLLDWELPGLKPADAGRRLLATLHAQQPLLQVIMLSGRPESNRSALAAGADLFVSKTEPPDRLLAALRGAHFALNRRIQPSAIYY